MKKRDARLWAWKAVDVDFTTRDGFQWPFPGNEVRSDDAIMVDNHTPCPEQTGDGLCLAKTFAGAAARGKSTHTVLVCSYLARDVLGQDDNKLRVRCCTVVLLWDAHKVLQRGSGANLSRADLRGAYLSGAYLRCADLSCADLRGADMRGAYLSGAYLRCADL